MDAKQRDTIIKALEQHLDEVDGDLFDQMDEVRLALKEWDMEGEIPYAEELDAWGVLSGLESELPTDEPSLDEAEEIIHVLRKRIRQAEAGSAEHTALKKARAAVQAWRKADCAGPLPHAEDLTSWGIWPPLPATDAVPDEPTDQPEPAPSASQPEQEPSEAPSEAAPTPPEKQPESPPDTPEQEIPPDPDDHLKPEYEKATHLIDQGHAYQGVEILTRLQAQACAGLANPIAQALSKARVELEVRTEELLGEARRTAAEFPDDYERQGEAWRAVVAVNPESAEAQEALTQLQQRVRRAVEEEIAYIAEEAKRAVTNRNLPDLNECLGHAGGLQLRGKSGELPPELYQQVEVLATDIAAKRQQLRDVLGVASTSAVQGDLKGAYQLARDYFEKTTPILVDTAGILGPPDAEVPTGDFFREVSTRFLAATRTKVDERLAAARGTKRPRPDAALADLEEARTWITDDVWTMDHRGDLKPQLEEVDHEIEDVKRLLDRFEVARTKISEGRTSEQPAQERLRLLVEASEIYPDYPAIAEYIEQARDDRAAELAGEVKSHISEAQRQVLARQYEQALQTLNSAREDAIRVVPEPKPDSFLQRALDHLAQEITAVQQAEHAYEQLMAVIGAIEDALQRYDDDQNLSDLSQAREMFNQLDETQRQDPEVRKVHAQLAALQGDSQNYEDGQRAYNQRDWAGAREYLGKISAGFAQNEEAQRLSKRALAALETTAAQKAEEHKDWKKALDAYTLACDLFKENGSDGLTRSISRECRDGRARLRPIEKNDRQVRRGIDAAKQALEQAKARHAQRETLHSKLEPIPEFAAAVKTLEEKAQAMSSLGSEVDLVLGEARLAWQLAYMDALRKVLAIKPEDRPMMAEIFQMARERAKELEQAHLLNTPETKKLRFRLESACLDMEYERLISTTQPDWKEIEQNRQAKTRLPGIKKPPTLQEELTEARQKRIAGEIRDKKEAEGAAAAKEYLTNQIQVGSLPAGPELLRLLIGLCWDVQDWEAAEAAATRFEDTSLEDSKTQVAIWQGLTRAARFFFAGDIGTAESYLTELRKSYSGDVIDETEDELRQRTMERLLGQAESKMSQLDQNPAGATPEDYLDAARKYAQAYALDNQNEVARHGLQRIGKPLARVVESLCQKAEDIKLGRDSLGEACRKAGSLHTDLSSILKVAAQLHLDANLQTRLEGALSQLEERRRLWTETLKGCDFFEQEVADAMAIPEPLADVDDDSSGGWEFESVRHILRDLQNQAAKARDRELQQRLQTYAQRLDRCEETAQQVMDLVRPLMKAIHNEEFQRTVGTAQEVGLLWRQIVMQEPGWDGLRTIVRYTYRWPTAQEVDQVKKHREHAEQQQTNYEAWKRYTGEVNALYAQLAEVEEELLSDTLDALKIGSPLQKIVDQCDTWTQRCDTFLRKLEQDMPLPQSAKAEQERLNIRKEERLTRIRNDMGTKAQVATLKAEAQQLQEILQPSLEKLERFWNALPRRIKSGRTRPQQVQIDTAVRLYRECTRIDPRNKKLLNLKKRFEGVGINFT